MNDAPKTKVFIVEDSPAVRDALVDLLECRDDLTVAGSADSVAGAIDAIRRCQPDYVVLDFQILGGTALDVLRALHPVMRDVVFIVLTNHAGPAYRRVCLDAGASWFLDKTREFASVKQIIARLPAST